MGSIQLKLPRDQVMSEIETCIKWGRALCAVEDLSHESVADWSKRNLAVLEDIFDDKLACDVYRGLCPGWFFEDPPCTDETREHVGERVHYQVQFLESLLGCVPDLPTGDLPDKPPPLPPPQPVTDPRNVFVVHGRNRKAREALFQFLRSIDLHPVEWDQAVAESGAGTPYVGEVLDAVFGTCQAAIVLLTGDDEACLREGFRGDREPDYEVKPTPQARQNVLFEMGMAFVRYRDRVVTVQLGEVRPFSDTIGRHTIRMDDSHQNRQRLAERLRDAGCAVDMRGSDWHSAGRFSDSILPTQQDHA